MRIRGSSSSYEEKKQYGFKFIHEDGDKRSRELFGMPKSADWILFTAYFFDPVTIRGPLVYEFDRTHANTWASR
jgi:hypothetical protein